jgi:phosphoserine phosphatase
MKEPGTERGEDLCVALFDVDGTLIRSSSGFVATRFMFKRGMIGTRHMLLGLWYAMLHGLGLTSYERMYEIGIRIFVGMRVDELLNLSRISFEKHVLPRFFTGALEAVQDQRESGRESDDSKVSR